MAADLNELVAEFRDKVTVLLSACAKTGVIMRPSTGLRDPLEQGRLWRQSRSIEEISEKIKSLKQHKAPFLAHCIESVGPQDGKHVTNAIPGLSWHQWGEALDCFWLLDGKAEWSTKRLVGGQNGYQVMANMAESVKLDAGGHWPKFKDWPHLQLQKAGSPLQVHDLAAIDKAMQQRFS